jgi:hypothetical protein
VHQAACFQTSACVPVVKVSVSEAQLPHPGTGAYWAVIGNVAAPAQSTVIGPRGPLRVTWLTAGTTFVMWNDDEDEAPVAVANVTAPPRLIVPTRTNFASG